MRALSATQRESLKGLEKLPANPRTDKLSPSVTGLACFDGKWPDGIPQWLDLDHARRMSATVTNAAVVIAGSSAPF